MSEEAVGCGGMFLSSHIALQNKGQFYREQWDYYHYQQKNRIFTDVIIQVNDGSCVELHQAVLAPLSPLFAPLEPTLTILLPDYKIYNVQALIDLLYTGRCELTDPYTELTEIISLAHCLCLSSIIMENLTLTINDYQHKKFDSGNVSPESVKETSFELLDQLSSSRQVNKSCCHSNTDPVKKLKYRRKQQPDLSCCPICFEMVEGGRNKLRNHLVDKHFYKQLSARLGRNTKNCPVCFKPMIGRSNLIKHYGTKHGVIDALLEEMNTKLDNSKLGDNVLKKIHQNSSNQSKNKFDVSNHIIDIVESPLNDEGLFECVLCPRSRKNKFRLLQHYCVTHFRDRLVKELSPMFEDNEGQCRLCGKKFEEVLPFTVHIGAGHQKVLRYLEEPQPSQFKEENNNSIVHCEFSTCSESIFPNNSSLMRHLSVKHFRKQLVNVLKPKFEESKKCKDCGKQFSLFQPYMIHCATTHKLVSKFYLKFLRVKEKIVPSTDHVAILNGERGPSDNLEIRPPILNDERGPSDNLEIPGGE